MPGRTSAGSSPISAASTQLAFAGSFARCGRHLARAIEEGQQAGDIDRRLDPNATAASIIGLVDGLLMQKLLDARALGKSEDVVRTLFLLITKGLTS